MGHVVILGGGFGGLAAARALRERLPASDEITLVDRRDSFAMGFAKLWDLAGVRPLAEGMIHLDRLPESGIGFRRAEIVALDPATRTVETTAGTLAADGIVVALGVAPSPAHRALLAGPDAHDLYDRDALPAMHAALDAVTAGRVVVSILGTPYQCPPAPYEGALVVAERLRTSGRADAVEVVVTTPQPATLPVAGPDASRFVADRLGEHDVELLTGRVVREVDAASATLRFDDGDDLAFSVLLGVPACAPPPLVAPSGLAAASGWIEPDRTTLRTAFDRVYAVGDCTLVRTATGQLPKAGVFAATQGEVAAANLAADLHGGPGAEFDGHGMCFLELPGRRVAFVEGDFFAEPEPDVRITEADTAHFARKQAYERERLASWVPG